MHKHNTYVHVHVCQQQLDLPLFDLVFLIGVVTVSVIYLIVFIETI